MNKSAANKIKNNHLAAAAMCDEAASAVSRGVKEIESKYAPETDEEWEMVDEMCEEIYSKHGWDRLSTLKVQAEDALLDALLAHQNAWVELQGMARDAGINTEEIITKGRRILSVRTKLLSLAHRTL